MSSKDERLQDKSEADSDDYLPRSLYVPEKDPRRHLREIVDSVLSDRFMMFLSVLLVFIILIPFIITPSPSVVTFLETCDWVIVVLFVIEYVSKLFLAQNRWKHFKSPWHLVDLVIVVLPFIQLFTLGISVTGSPSLLLRLLRLPRAIAVGGRAVVGRRSSSIALQVEQVKGPDTIISQLDSDLNASEGSLTWDELKAHILDSNRQEWLDIHNVSEEGFSTLSEIMGVSRPHFKSRLVDEIYPHIDYVQHVSFIFLQSGEIKYPEHAGHYLTISRSGIIVICNGTKIITVSRHGLDLFQSVLTSVNRAGTDGAFVVKVLYGIMEHMLEEYRAILSEIELEVIKIGGTPRSKLPRDFLERIYQLDREALRLVSNLVHFKEMLSILISKKVPLKGFDQRSEEAFHVLQDDASYLNEIADDLMGNLRSIIDLYINKTSFETNRILKILAVITSISVIPSAVGGLMGMNMLDAPFGAYLWQIILLTGIVMSLVTYIFVKLGWLKT
ncbi:MAG: CorA family divalent cation transporter [Candidatus Bathyarchaeia archaeon]